MTEMFHHTGGFWELPCGWSLLRIGGTPSYLPVPEGARWDGSPAAESHSNGLPVPRGRNGERAISNHNIFFPSSHQI